MTVVQNTTSSPGGAHAKRLVYVTLIAGANGAPGYTSTSTVVGTYTVETDDTGHWSIDLPPNSGFTPSNSYYQVTEEGGTSLIVVPASGGPYNLSQLLVTSPPALGALGITGVQVAVGGTIEGDRPEINLIPGAGMQINAVDNAGSNRVDVTLTSTGGASPATTVVTEETYGEAAAVGALSSYAREDHTHGSPPLASTPPTSSAPGDAAATGTASTPAKADHLHGREAFGNVTALAAFGTASSNGAAATPSRSDHVHGAPALPAATTTTAGIVQVDGTAADIQSLGTQAAGSTGKAADAGHVHPTTGVYSRQLEIAANGPASTVVTTIGAWTPTFLTNAQTGNFVGWVNQSDGTQNDSISFDFACEAGTYSLELHYLPFTNRGIYTVKVDATSVGTVDGYATGLSPQRAVLTGIALTSGQHTVTLLMATKNASATSYIGMVERILLTRTA